MPFGMVEWTITNAYTSPPIPSLPTKELRIGNKVNASKAQNQSYKTRLLATSMFDNCGKEYDLKYPIHKNAVGRKYKGGF